MMMHKALIIACVLALICTAAYADPFNDLKNTLQNAGKTLTDGVNTAVNGARDAVNTVTNGTNTAFNATKQVLGINNAAGQTGPESLAMLAAAGLASLLLLAL